MASPDLKSHPCLTCGACCAFFRVTFHWSETLAESFGVPGDLTSPVSAHLLAMKGTDRVDGPRCVSLEGEVGRRVGCAIYDRRPGPCREFKVSFEDGTRDERCEKARASWGLGPLTPVDWEGN